MIEYIKKTTKIGESKKSKKYSRGSWIKVVDPTEKEINFLVKEFGLERDNLDDGLDLNEIPRIEEEKGNSYIFLRVPTSKISGESSSSFLVISNKSNIITISKHDLEIFDKVKDLRRLFTNRNSLFILQLLSYISSRFNFEVRKILKEVKTDKRNILKLKNKDILDLVLEEDKLNNYLSSFSPLIGMHQKMIKLKSLKFRDNEKEFIEDLIIDLNQTLNTSKAALKTISNMRDYYSTTLSNNINKTITILTVFTVFLTIPAVFSSIYGMNLSLPFQANPLTFWFLGGMVVVIWAILFFAFKKGKII
jgi:magnesium transporter